MPDESASRSLAINSGSSSIKFALFFNTKNPSRIVSGNIERMGSPEAELTLTEADGSRQSFAIAVADHHAAATEILQRLQAHVQTAPLTVIGHRIVHGGPNYSDSQIITPALIEELKRLSEFVPNHLPAEIAMVEALGQRLPKLPQVACFDTAFHHDLPEVAKVLPIPGKYEARGIRRYGFHGLSYAYLLEELARVAGPATANGKIIFAHLGSGASMAAVVGGKCFDTTMGFTPTGGLVMATRTGDLDPGLLAYLLRTNDITTDQIEDLINKQSGLLGLSETSGDIRDLLAKEQTDTRCALAISKFCYEARKWIGAYAAAMGGLDTIVFSAGIGEHASVIRQRICQGLEFLGVQINNQRNTDNAPVITEDGSPVVVRVIPTDEELMIARAMYQLTL